MLPALPIMPRTPPCRPIQSTEGMLAYMKRTTIKIPDDLDARLRHEASLRGMTISEVSREALETFLDVGPQKSSAQKSSAQKSSAQKPTGSGPHR